MYYVPIAQILIRKNAKKLARLRKTCFVKGGKHRRVISACGSCGRAVVEAIMICFTSQSLDSLTTICVLLPGALNRLCGSSRLDRRRSGEE